MGVESLASGTTASDAALAAAEIKLGLALLDVVGFLRARGLSRIEPSVQAEHEWGGRVGELAGRTLRYTCGSWDLGVNIPGKPRVFMLYIGGFPRYVGKCDEVAGREYEGFVLA